MARSSQIILVFCLVLTLSWLGCNQQEETTADTDSEPTLQVTDVVVGDGQALAEGDYCSVHYRGWFYQDGQKGDEFDNSLGRGEPLTFRLGREQVIPGWDEGLVGMRTGGKRNLIVPPELAFGQRGNAKIPPNSTLLFEVELVDISKVETQILTSGTGPVGEEGDQVKVHFTGWIAEDGGKGNQFDSTYERNLSFDFTLGAGHVIPGLEMGILGMRVGEKRLLTIPAVLAYGSRGRQQGAQQIVPPNATVLFEVELLEVLGKQ